MDEAEFHSLIDRAFAALRNGDDVRAVAIGDQLVAAAPEDAVARAIRAQALLGTDAAEESLDEARRAVDLAPNDERAHLLLGLGRLADPAAHAGPAIVSAGDRALSGRRPAMLSEYAWFMATERGPRLAEQAAQDAVEADAGSSTAWAALGLAQYRLHRRQDAEGSVRRALKLNPNDIYAQSAMVALLQDRHEDAKAGALAELVGEHAGAEELAESVRKAAKQRQIARMLVERKVDVGGPVREPRTFRWIWLLIGAGLLAPLANLIDPRGAYAVALITLLLLFSAAAFLGLREKNLPAPFGRGAGGEGLVAMHEQETLSREARRMNRRFQALLIVSTAGLSWLLMMVLHECGHMAHGWPQAALRSPTCEAVCCGLQ